MRSRFGNWQDDVKNDKLSVCWEAFLQHEFLFAGQQQQALNSYLNLLLANQNNSSAASNQQLWQYYSQLLAQNGAYGTGSQSQSNANFDLANLLAMNGAPTSNLSYHLPAGNRSSNTVPDNCFLNNVDSSLRMHGNLGASAAATGSFADLQLTSNLN
ncbi:hypothetical protein Ciccas_005098 [Cichlidogyrus casuarinus]|uniref:Uncharacterized protein n=1 Tax=Cichlidogyrus casuarinus TaxID=1844966 RepID=A0ABD2Q9L9_9PLAT